MAAGDKVYLADKPTLDATKSNTDTIKTNVNTANTNINTINTKIGTSADDGSKLSLFGFLAWLKSYWTAARAAKIDNLDGKITDINSTIGTADFMPLDQKIDEVLQLMKPIGLLTWEEIASISQSGMAEAVFTLGMSKSVTLTTGETIIFEIAGFNHDDKVGGGKAGITFIAKAPLQSTRQMNPTNTNAGGWGSSAMRTFVSGTVLNQLPADLKSVIKEVKKKTQAGNQSSAIVETQDKLWLPSFTEVGFNNTGYSPGGEGSIYPIFVGDSTRIKGSAVWWLRSPNLGGTTHFCGVAASGGLNNAGANYSNGVVLGFCV